MFPVMGLPSILQSDNGREFVNKLIEVVVTWPGQVQLVSGRPRHSLLVEQAPYTLERMMSAKIAESGAEHPLGLIGYLILPVRLVHVYTSTCTV